ncbi:ATP-binding protein [Haloarcula marismortui]|uniref:ATP-binding protein n=1 Tax=Haloarcula marismortui TaxID=2238 RepID=UPI003C745FA4
MTRPLEKTKFWDRVMRDIYGPREGGVIIAIDAENARKGVAKTSAAVALADRLAYEFGYDLVEDDGVLSAQGVFERYEAHPGEEQPSVLVWDEAVGAGSGDARRAMSTDNVKLGRAWQVLRTARVVTITTLPNWGDLDSRLQRFCDYRLWCREWPIGEFLPYKVGTDFDGKTVTTEGLGYGRDGDATPIGFPDASADFQSVGDTSTGAHPLYQRLSEKKERLMGTEDFTAGEMRETAKADGGIDPELREQVENEAQRREAIKTVIRACQPWDDDGLSYAKASNLVDYSREWVGNRVREWKDEYEHRDLVDDPTSG